MAPIKLPHDNSSQPTFEAFLDSFKKRVSKLLRNHYDIIVAISDYDDISFYKVDISVTLKPAGTIHSSPYAVKLKEYFKSHDIRPLPESGVPDELIDITGTDFFVLEKRDVDRL